MNNKVNTDRGIIKWLPFNSVVDSKTIIKNIEKEKKKETKIQLTEEQIEMIEKDLVESLHNQSQILILYYKKGIYYKKKSIISKIDQSNKKITLIDHSSLYFEQIIKTKII